MKIKLSKTSAQGKIEEFFKKIESKSPKEIRKIKRLAMNKKVPLKDKRKLFCKKCLVPYQNSKIRIKKGRKSVECKNCNYVSGWKIK